MVLFNCTCTSDSLQNGGNRRQRRVAEASISFISFFGGTTREIHYDKGNDIHDKKKNKHGFGV